MVFIPGSYPLVRNITLPNGQSNVLISSTWPTMITLNVLRLLHSTYIGCGEWKCSEHKTNILEKRRHMKTLLLISYWLLFNMDSSSIRKRNKNITWAILDDSSSSSVSSSSSSFPLLFSNTWILMMMIKIKQWVSHSSFFNVQQEKCSSLPQWEMMGCGNKNDLTHAFHERFIWEKRSEGDGHLDRQHTSI